jgi:signal transduction histidine kinase
VGHDFAAVNFMSTASPLLNLLCNNSSGDSCYINEDNKMKVKIPYVLCAVLSLLICCSNACCESLKPEYEATKKLILLVNEAASLLEMKGEAAFNEFVKPGTKWNHGETYIIVFDLLGNTLVHADPNEIGKNRFDLIDINGKPIFKSILAKVTGPDKEGWTHYFWPKPNDVFPTWKSTYSRIVQAPSGKEYIVSCGLYNMRMEKMFMVEQVNAAIDLIKEEGKVSFVRFRNKYSDFFYLNTYIFIIDAHGVDLINPAFPNLEGRNMYNMRDEAGKYLIREMIEVAKTKGSGWVEYLWPKPGDANPVKKLSFVKAVKLNDEMLVVGSGIYLD